MQRLNEHRRLFRRIWKAFASFAARVIARGDTVAFEWPRNCSYWSDPAVVAFLREWKLEMTHFDGCAFYLHDSVGRALKKPWSVCTNSTTLARMLARRCNRDHRHGVTNGPNCVISERYTRHLANRIHQAFVVLVSIQGLKAVSRQRLPPACPACHVLKTGIAPAQLEPHKLVGLTRIMAVALLMYGASGVYGDLINNGEDVPVFPLGLQSFIDAAHNKRRRGGRPGCLRLFKPLS